MNAEFFFATFEQVASEWLTASSVHLVTVRVTFIDLHHSFSALRLLVGRQKELPASRISYLSSAERLASEAFRVPQLTWNDLQNDSRVEQKLKVTVVA